MLSVAIPTMRRRRVSQGRNLGVEGIEVGSKMGLMAAPASCGSFFLPSAGLHIGDRVSGMAIDADGRPRVSYL